MKAPGRSLRAEGHHERLGMDTVNGWLDAWGCPRTRLRRRTYDLDAAARGIENVVTPSRRRRGAERAADVGRYRPPRTYWCGRRPL
ncbi:MAG: hypothetical protein EXR61_04220 [Chloroflexi bacterium]|nr:hypothetical protein [Chloroflexota bacterium]